MEASLRQRIIGAIVLAVMAVIFIPLLFKGGNNSTTDSKPITLSAPIPPATAKPANAPQTIVMIKNKDLSTPPTEGAKIAAAPQMAMSKLPPTTSSATNTAVISQPIPSINNGNTTTASNIDLAENETLNPADLTEINKTPAVAPASKKTTIKTAHAKTSTVKSTKKLAKTKHETISKKTVSKKHQELKYAKAGKTKVSSNKSAPTALASAQTSKTAKIAWEVRLGSFANSNKANDLLKQLRAHGFKAYAQNTKTSLGKLTRVVIGPETKREKADIIQSRLAKELKIKSEVVPYTTMKDG